MPHLNSVLTCFRRAITLKAIEFLKTIVGQRKPDMSEAPLAVVSKSWLMLVISDGGTINYKAYTFCVLRAYELLCVAEISL